MHLYTTFIVKMNRLFPCGICGWMNVARHAIIISGGNMYCFIANKEDNNTCKYPGKKYCPGPFAKFEFFDHKKKKMIANN